MLSTQAAEANNGVPNDGDNGNGNGSGNVKEGGPKA